METDGAPATEETNTTEQLFDSFLYDDNTLLKTLEQFSELKTLLNLNDVPHYQFFSKLKAHFSSWRHTSFMEILQRRLNVKDYVSCVEKCKDCNIFIIGAGPCGLRSAIEAALCGAYVVVGEKRTSFTRNNVLHLWPYLIHDLRNLGVKKLYGMFCAGSLDHISIRRLQLILMKIALVLGVKVFTNTSFVEFLEPCNTTGWRISVKPSNTEIEMTDFDVLVGADGKRNSIPGFQRKEFRAKLAIGITANFKNKKSEDEAKIEEISGVAALFNQKFFADLKSETDIDLENIVYYKDDTHYFVMTAKKQCLLKKGVLKEDHGDVIKLLAYQNVDNPSLLNFVSEAADFSTGLPHTDFAVNPDNNRPDVAIFDFTSMYSAEYAAKILERRGKRLIIGLVGDGLMEPFWPLGTGCARGFLSCMDLMWMIQQHQSGTKPKELLEERMALFKILHQTSNENMNKKHSAYTMNPKSRYRLIPKYSEDLSFLYENDDKENVNKQDRIENYSPEKTSPNKRLAGETTETVHKQWKKSTFARTRKPKNPSNESGVLAKKRSLSPSRSDDQETLRKWCSDRLKLILPYLPVTDLDTCWRDGVLLCGLVHLCSPKDMDMSVVKSNSDSQNVDLAISVMFNELGIQTLTAQDVLPPSGPDLLAIISTILELQKVYQTVDNVLLDNKPVKKTKLATSENEKPASQPALPASEPTAVDLSATSPDKVAATPEKPTPMLDQPSPGDLKRGYTVRGNSGRKLKLNSLLKWIMLKCFLPPPLRNTLPTKVPRSATLVHSVYWCSNVSLLRGMCSTGSVSCVRIVRLY
ncbi:F-actin-monooxygenase mical2b-like isoform X2 [Bolinopsis microptera]|uniref:F-actin-monooxygenase mical2b-like isoform X2 n=1 Tax=Bolinopsis microptera TaxID=2820187 RepID=UPI00307AACBA